MRMGTTWWTFVSAAQRTPPRSGFCATMPTWWTPLAMYVSAWTGRIRTDTKGILNIRRARRWCETFPFQMIALIAVQLQVAHRTLTSTIHHAQSTAEPLDCMRAAQHPGMCVSPFAIYTPVEHMHATTTLAGTASTRVLLKPFACGCTLREAFGWFIPSA